MDHRWQTGVFSALSNTELYALLRLRQEVFSLEQNCIYLDLDNLDQPATHMLCWQGSELLAYQRCLPPGLNYPDSSLGRIVVCQAARGTQLGRELVRRGMDYNLLNWPHSAIRINAQAYLLKFYERLGFVGEGDEYDYDGIPHIQMLYKH
jgi:ElaA protein